MVPLNRPSPKTLVGPNISGLSAIQADLGNFVQIFGSKFWAWGGAKQKSKNNVLKRGTWRTDSQKMARFHQETKKKKQFEGALSLWC